MCEVVFVVAISGRRHLYLFHSWQRLSLRGRNQRIISRYGNPQHFIPAKSQHSADMPWMYIDLWFTVGDFSNVQYETFDDGRLIFVHVARATRDDRDVSVPRVREAAVVTLNVIGEAFEDVSFADVCGAGLGSSVQDDVDPAGADQLNQVDVAKSLKLSVNRLHRLLPRLFPECLLSHRG